MKLTSAQVERTLTQFEGEVIPDNHPVVPQLNSLFGEHTFFLDSHGLNIVEPEAAGSGAQSAKVVNVANWSGANPNRLEAHPPADFVRFYREQSSPVTNEPAAFNLSRDYIVRLLNETIAGCEGQDIRNWKSGEQ